LNFFRGFLPPKGLEPTTRKNFINVQIDAIGVGLANSASPFLPVFLTRLGATAFQISLLTTMPAIAGFLLAIPLGRLLQKQRRIIPWFSGSRLAVLSSYAFTGLLVFFIPQEQLITAILLIWAIATIPQTLLSITFSVVMNAVAGPSGRFDLMTRRWSTMGLTTTITVLIMGQLLGWFSFPVNYQIMFICLSIGGLISFYFSSHIVLADVEQPIKIRTSPKNQINEYLNLIKYQKPFTSFIAKRFVYLTGVSLAAPLFPIYFVREIEASDSWIATITVIQSAVMIIGYYFWTRTSRSRGTRFTLLWTTAGLSFYPILTAITHQSWIISIYAGLAGIFQAGLDLVFFDELMKTVPPKYSATFVSFAQSVQYVSAIASPLIGSFLAVHLGISFALIISGGVRLLGFSLFLLGGQKQEEPVPEALNSD
jgi:MFS family permease